MSRALSLIVFLCLLASPLAAQYHLLGNAAYMPDGRCIQLTADAPYMEGIAYHQSRLDLNNTFEISFDIFLGDKDSLGADGMAFVLHNDERAYQAYGTFGESMGYGRMNPFSQYGAFIAPSVAIEFDTYWNPRQNDPFCDHVAFLVNGSNYHDAYWNGGNPAFNLEDNQLHDFRFRWSSTRQQITVFLDGTIVYQGQHDLVNDVFGGQSLVIWGWTASTGNKYNLQYFCLRRLAYGTPNQNQQNLPLRGEHEPLKGKD